MDPEGRSGPGSLRHPLDALKDLYGMEGLRDRLEAIGQRIQVRQREGRSTAGIVGNMVFTG